MLFYTFVISGVLFVGLMSLVSYFVSSNGKILLKAKLGVIDNDSSKYIWTVTPLIIIAEIMRLVMVFSGTWMFSKAIMYYVFSKDMGNLAVFISAFGVLCLCVLTVMYSLSKPFDRIVNFSCDLIKHARVGRGKR